MQAAFQTDILSSPTFKDDQRSDDVKTRAFTSHQQPDQKPWLSQHSQHLQLAAFAATFPGNVFV